MTDNFLKAQAFKLKGRLYTFTVLELMNADLQVFEQHLSEVIAQAPKLFDNTPIILDCSAMQEADADTEINLEGLFHCLRAHGMVPVGIQGANPLLTVMAQAQGIAVLHGSKAHDKRLSEDREPSEHSNPSSSNNPHNPNKMIATPVRSGQQVVSKGGDLIVRASVSHGAELLADGNIHVYGVLRGRALAGLSGDRNARIFCQSLDAELVSIAGFYRLSDAMKPSAVPCQIYLEDEHIVIENL